MTPDIDGDLLDRLQLELAEHRGRENAITSGPLARRVGISESRTNAKLREAVKVLTRERNVPVVSSNAGFYIPATRAEKDEYLQNLDQRIAGIQQRKELVDDAWDARYASDGGDA